MFDSIWLTIWLANIVMVAFSITVWVRFFSYLRPPHFFEHKAIAMNTMFMSAITISTLVESVFQYVYFHQQTPMGYFPSVISSVMASVLVFVSISPPFLFFKEKSMRIFSWLYGVFFVGAVLCEALACIFFYLSWMHS